MAAGTFSARHQVGYQQSDPGRRPAPVRRAEAPLRKIEPNLRRSDTVNRPTLAIDLGTCGSSATLVSNDRDVLAEDPDLGQPVWPSTVAYDGVGPRVGGAAESFMRVHPERGVARIKELLGETAPVQLGEHSFPPVDLISWLIAAMRAEAERAGGVETTRAVLSIPVGYGFGDSRRDTLLRSAALAGFDSIELIYEPLAILGSSLVGGPLGPGDMVLVCDLGASGFRATLASLLKGGTVELLGHRNDIEFSGREIDRLIMTEVMARAGGSWAELMRQPSEPTQRLKAIRRRRQFEDLARQMKQQLSTHPSAIELVGPDEVPVELTAPQLRALTMPPLLRAVDGLKAVLVGAGVRPGELAAVVLSGGGSRMPFVSEVISDTFHRPIRLTVDQHRAVVEGAARFAHAAERRHVRARVAMDRETPLRWDVPGGLGGELQWLKAMGTRFSAIEPLAVVRLPDGSLWELRSGRAGKLIRIHVQDGAQIASGDWLVTVELDVRPFR
jgi:molecular chaperone DnaK (HSP70)